MAIYEIIQSPPPKTMCSKNGEKIISLMCHFFPKMNFSAPKLEQSEPCQLPIFKHFVSHTPKINGYPETKTICYSFFLSVKKILVYLKNGSNNQKSTCIKCLFRYQLTKLGYVGNIKSLHEFGPNLRSQAIAKHNSNILKFLNINIFK